MSRTWNFHGKRSNYYRRRAVKRKVVDSVISTLLSPFLPLIAMYTVPRYLRLLTCLVAMGSVFPASWAESLKGKVEERSSELAGGANESGSGDKLSAPVVLQGG